jgi:hypothetical protein
MKAKSISGGDIAEISDALVQTIRDGFSPTLALVFLSVKQDHVEICDLLSAKGIAIYGSTTNGEFTEKGITKEGIAILLLDVNRNYFDVLFSEYPDKQFRATTRTMAEKALKKFSDPSFLIAGQPFGN